MPKTMKQVFLMVILILTGVQSKAANGAVMGGESSGGGGGFYCSDDGAVYTLDLWEGINILGYTIPYSFEHPSVQINRALQNLEKIAPHLAVYVRPLIKELQSSALELPSGVELAFPDDAKPIYQKPGCKLVGLMVYDGDQGRIRYNATYVSRLSFTDLAGIWVHEAVYKALRDHFDESSSVATRKIVACIFSTNGCIDKMKTLEQILPKNQDVFKCSNESVEYYYFNSPVNHGNTAVVLSRFRGMTTDYPAYNLTSGYKMPRSHGGVFGEHWTVEEVSSSLLFQGFEKSNYRVVIEQIYRPLNSDFSTPDAWDGFFPAGTLEAIAPDIFNIFRHSTSCSKYHGS